MRPLVIDGVLWRVVRVRPDDPRLTDRTGTRTVATTNPRTREICLSEALQPPFLDRVMLHEVSHAIALTYGLLGRLRGLLDQSAQVPVEEWAAGMVEGYGIEAAELASMALGRPVCVRGFCHD